MVVHSDFLNESNAAVRPGKASLAAINILSTAAPGVSNAGRTSIYMEDRKSVV